MAVRLADAVAYLAADDTALKSGLDRGKAQISTWGSVTQGILQGVGQQMYRGVIDASNTAMAFVGDAISKASNLGETINKVDTIFAESSDAMKEWSKNSAESMGLSQQAALDAAGTMGNMWLQLGANEEAAASSSQAMIQLSADLASFHNVAGGSEEVLGAMQSAFRGEYDSLQRFIPTINAATVEAKALQMGLAEATVDMGKVNEATAQLTIAQQRYTEVMSGTTATDEQKRAALEGLNDAQARQEKAVRDAALAQAQYDATMADSEKTAEQRQAAQNRLADAQARLADSTDDVNNAQMRVEETNRATLPTAADQAAAALKVEKAQAALNDALSGQTGELSALAKAQAAQQLIMEGAGAATGDFAKTSDGLANSTRILEAQMADMSAQLGQELLPIKLKVVQALGWLIEKFTALSPTVQKWIGVGAGLLAILGPILPALAAMASGISAIIGLVGGASGIVSALGAVVAVLGGPVTLAIGAVVAAAALLYKAWQGNWFGIRDTLTNVWEWMKGMFSSMVTGFTNLGGSIVQGLKNGVSNAWSGLKSWWGGLWDGLVSSAKGFLGISSPSRVFADEVGEPIVEGVGAGIERGGSALRRSLVGAIERARNGIGNVEIGGLEIDRAGFGENLLTRAVAVKDSVVGTIERLKAQVGNVQIGGPEINAAGFGENLLTRAVAVKDSVFGTIEQLKAQLGTVKIGGLEIDIAGFGENLLTRAVVVKNALIRTVQEALAAGYDVKQFEDLSIGVMGGKPTAADPTGQILARLQGLDKQNRSLIGEYGIGYGYSYNRAQEERSEGGQAMAGLLGGRGSGMTINLYWQCGGQPSQDALQAVQTLRAVYG